MVNKRKLYLSKSNRANPDHVMMVRAHLEYLGYEIVEHKGGEYNARLLFDCAIMVMVGIERPSVNNEGIVKIGKGQYGQLRDRINHAPASTLRNLYFTHTETNDDGIEIPIFKQVITAGVHDPNNWITEFGLLKVKMDGHTKLSNIALHSKKRPRPEKCDEDTDKQEVDLTDPRSRWKHLACITLFK